MRLVTRSQLGWPGTAAGTAPCRNGVAVHYVGGNALSLSNHSQCISMWRGFRTFHMGPQRRWADIGYSYGVCPHGYVLEGRGFGRAQAAQPGGNTTWTSVCFLLGGTQQPTAGHLQAFRDIRAWLRSRGVAAAVRPHSSFIATSCPGNALRSRISSGNWGGGSSNPTPTPIPSPTPTPRPPSGGGVALMGDEMIGLKRGDKGERVVGLQVVLKDAGFGSQLGNFGPDKDGVDGDYGPATSRAVLAARRSVGSKVDSGDRVSGWAYAQILRALIRKVAG